MPSSCVCTSVDCVVGWYGSQAANNTFTLAGAIAAAAVAVLALRLSLIRNRADDAAARAKAAVAAAQAEVVIQRAIERLFHALAPAVFSDSQSDSEVVARLRIAFAIPVEPVDINTAALLVPLGGGLATGIAKAFASIEAAETVIMKLTDLRSPGAEPSEAAWQLGRSESVRLMSEALEFLRIAHTRCAQEAATESAPLRLRSE